MAVLGHTHPCVHRKATAGERQHRVEVELGDLRQVRGQQGEAQEEVDKRALIGRRRSSEAGDEPAGLAGANELVRRRGR